jgi:hypothetical protein
VCHRHCGLAIQAIEEEELWKLKYFTMQKYIIFKTILYKKKPKYFKILLL